MLPFFSHLPILLFTVFLFLNFFFATLLLLSSPFFSIIPMEEFQGKEPTKLALGLECLCGAALSDIISSAVIPTPCHFSDPTLHLWVQRERL